PRAGAPPGARVLTVGGADGGRAVARRPRGGGVLAQRGSCGHAEARAAAAGGPAIRRGAGRGRLTVARAGGGGGRRRRRTLLRGRGTVLVPAAVRCVAVRGPGLRRHRGGRRAGLGQDPLRLRGMLVLDEQFVLHRYGGRPRGEVPLTPGL